MHKKEKKPETEVIKGKAGHKDKMSHADLSNPSKRWHIVLFEDKHGVDKDWTPKIGDMFGERCVYACWGFERGEETKTPHIHIYLHFSTTYRYTGIQKAFEKDKQVKNHKSIHCEVARSGAEYNKNYIHHLGKYEDKGCELVSQGEWGDLSVLGQGRRRDLSEWDKQCSSLIHDIEHSEDSLRDLIRRYPSHFIRSFRNIQAIHKYFKYLDWNEDMKSYHNMIDQQKDALKEGEEEMRKSRYILKKMREDEKLQKRVAELEVRFKVAEDENLNLFKELNQLRKWLYDNVQ